jgi:Na+(H+)/acetate symporter ActP
VSQFRTAAVIVAVVGVTLALALRTTDLSLSVGLSFALAASTFSPLLVLGVWWRGLTWPGAVAGMVIGGGLVLASLAGNIVSGYTGTTAPWFVVQPGLVTVPTAFVVTILVSLATPAGRPADVNAVMLRLHAPDPLGFMRDREVSRFGQAEEKARTRHGRHRK